MMFAFRAAWSFAIAWISSWWGQRKLRTAASAGEAAKVAHAYAERDNAVLRAENDTLNRQLEEKRDEPAPTSYDGDAERLARFVRARTEADRQ